MAWGDNTNGRLGANTTVAKSTPVILSSSVLFQYISTSFGGNSTFAIDYGNNLWAWGIGTSGVIGDNSTVAKCTPVLICKGENVATRGKG